jgi:hypothetical protein
MSSSSILPLAEASSMGALSTLHDIFRGGIMDESAKMKHFYR